MIHPFLWLLTLTLAAHAQEVLPGTGRWDFPVDIAGEQYRELRAFYEKQIEEAAAARPRWFAAASLEEKRRRLAELTGTPAALLPPAPTRVPLGATAAYAASLVNYPILRLGGQPPTRGQTATAVRLYGILLEPGGGATRPAVVVLPDAAQSAADLCGLTGRLAAAGQTARRLAEAGFVVFSPFLTQRRAFSQPWLEDRLWLMRLGYQTGRHIVGAEVAQTSSAGAFLASLDSVDAARIAVAGHGQGGLTAVLAGALDERFQAVYTSGYLAGLLPPWDEPEDRMLWRMAHYFGKQELAALVGSRRLIEGAALSGAPAALRARLVPPAAATSAAGAAPPAMDLEQVAEIANAQFTQWQAHFRNRALEAADALDKRWTPDFRSPAAYEQSLAAKREAYWDMVGRYPAAAGPLAARSIAVYDEPAFRGYRLSVRVYDGVHAYGILLVPKDLRPGEKRPVVFVQHGLGGRPEAALGVVPQEKDDAVYARFGLRLVERGYLVFAPMIATQDNAERTRLIRRAHPVGMIPAGMDVKKFARILDYLSTLPYADARRFAFYGLSYGGYTALWIGPGEPRFRAVIASGHYNDWNVKTTDLTLGTAFPLYFNVADQYNFGMLNHFNHADLASLIAPRAFMVEMGDQDGVIVAPRYLADREVDRALEIYRRLGIPQKGQISRFPGPHKIDGRDTYPFLDRMLGWDPQTKRTVGP